MFKYRNKPSGLRWIWIAIAIIMLDRLSKLLVQQTLIPYDILTITPFFNLVLAYNKGAAFSFLNQAAGWQVSFFGVIAVIVSIILMLWLKRISYQEKLLSVALNFIIGGALSNLIDRIAYGHVIDFIQLHAGKYYWPVFNIADTAICIGAGLLILETFAKRKKAAA